MVGGGVDISMLTNNPGCLQSLKLITFSLSSTGLHWAPHHCFSSDLERGGAILRLQYFLHRYSASLSPSAFPLPPWPPPTSTPSSTTPGGPRGLHGPDVPGAAGLKVYRQDAESAWRAEVAMVPHRPGAPASCQPAPSQTSH